jgi:hypothetical protein
LRPQAAGSTTTIFTGMAVRIEILFYRGYLSEPIQFVPVVIQTLTAWEKSSGSIRPIVRANKG